MYIHGEPSAQAEHRHACHLTVLSSLMGTMEQAV